MSRRDPGGGPPGVLLALLQVVVVIGALLSRRPVRKPLPAVDPEALALGYEHSDVRPAVVLGGAAALLAIMGMVLLAITLFEERLTGISPSISPPQDLIQGLQASPAPTPPAPRLEAQPGQEFGAYRAAQEQKLSNYRWVDRQGGVAAIPIDRAMDLLAQQGLPARAAPTVMPRDQGARSPSSASSGRVDEAYP